MQQDTYNKCNKCHRQFILTLNQTFLCYFKQCDCGEIVEEGCDDNIYNLYREFRRLNILSYIVPYKPSVICFDRTDSADRNARYNNCNWIVNLAYVFRSMIVDELYYFIKEPPMPNHKSPRKSFIHQYQINVRQYLIIREFETFRDKLCSIIMKNKYYNNTTNIMNIIFSINSVKSRTMNSLYLYDINKLFIEFYDIMMSKKFPVLKYEIFYSITTTTEYNMVQYHLDYSMCYPYKSPFEFIDSI